MAEINIDYRGLILARALYANVTISLVGVGILLFMSIYGLSVFIETPKQLRTGRARYIFLSFVITSLVALAASMDMAWMLKLLFGATSGQGFYQNVEKYYKPLERRTSGITIGLYVFIGDALLVYRCYVIWSHRKWVSVLPILTCLLAFAFGIIAYHVDINTDRQEAEYESARVFLSVGTNIIVTSLISFYLLRARRRLAKLIPAHDLELYTGIIAILIESALPLTIFGIIFAILTRTPAPASDRAAGSFLVAYQTFGSLFYLFCALSPVMIIFRITTGRSWTNFPKQGWDSNAGTPLNFARGTAESSFFQSSISAKREFGLSKGSEA